MAILSSIGRFVHFSKVPLCVIIHIICAGPGGVNLISEESLNSSLDSSEQTSEAGSNRGKKRNSTSK